MAKSDVFQNHVFEILNKGFKRSGMEEVIRRSNERLNKWEGNPFNIKQTGQCCVGKLSLMNGLIALMGLDEVAASAGVTATTETAESSHPKNENLVLYDLPGADTPKFSKSTYLTDKSTSFANYIVYIIVAADGLTEDNVYMVTEIAKQIKSFIFVCSQIYVDLPKEKQSTKTPEKQTINDNGKDCIIYQIYEAVANVKVCILDSYDTKHPLLEFSGGLGSRLMYSLPEWIREAFVREMSNKTASLIDEKRKVLAGRIQTLALLSAVGGALPVPGLSMAIDVGIMLEEFQFYHTQYGTTKAWKQIKIATKMSKEGIIRFLELSDFSSASMTAAMLVSLLPSIVASEVLERSATLFIPVLGSIIGGAMSYGTTVYALKQILAKVTEDAHKINKYMLQQTSVQEVKLSRIYKIEGTKGFNVYNLMKYR